MNKKTYGYLIGLFAVLFVAMGIVQLFRLDYPHRLIPSEKTKVRSFETTNTKTTEAKGEALRVYLLQNDSDLSKGVIQNFSYALKYAKIDYQRIRTSDIKTLDPSERTVLVLSGEHTKEWPYKTIRKFVRKGGKLYVAGRFIDPKWGDLVGVKRFGDFKENVKGMTFKKDLFPGYIDLSKSSTLFVHSIADVTLQNADVKIEAEGNPILWTHEYGKGEVLFWNTSSLLEKNSRGLLVQSLSLLFPTFVSQQVAVKLAHFDDFPAPVPDASNPAIQKNYDLTVKDFFADVWLRDMQRIAKEQDIIYSGFIIGSYRNAIDDMEEQLIENIRFPMLNFGRRLLKMGGELGLHGYNHQPLVINGETMDPSLGYTTWDDRSQMMKGIEEVKVAHQYFFPKEQIRSYVPPSNIIGPTGLSVLNEAFPDGLIIASLYNGDASKGSYIQEFEPDATYKNLYNFPRITSGYNESPEDMFVLADAVANFGLVSHFIHPDDVLDEQRSKGQGWPKMERSIEKMFQTIHTDYPYLESMTQYDGYKKMKLYQESKIDVRYSKTAIEISGSQMLLPSKMMVRVNDGKIATGSFAYGEVRKLGNADDLYEVELKKNFARIPVLGVSQ